MSTLQSCLAGQLICNQWSRCCSGADELSLWPRGSEPWLRVFESPGGPAAAPPARGSPTHPQGGGPPAAGAHTSAFPTGPKAEFPLKRNCRRRDEPRRRGQQKSTFPCTFSEDFETQPASHLPKPPTTALSGERPPLGGQSLGH